MKKALMMMAAGMLAAAPALADTVKVGYMTTLSGGTVDPACSQTGGNIHLPAGRHGDQFHQAVEAGWHGLRQQPLHGIHR